MASTRRVFKFLKERLSSNASIYVPKRNVVCTDTGAMLHKPETTRFGLVKAMTTVVPFLYLGATMSRKGAAFLEENDIFVPDDDDDD